MKKLNYSKLLLKRKRLRHNFQVLLSAAMLMAGCSGLNAPRPFYVRETGSYSRALRSPSGETPEIRDPLAGSQIGQTAQSYMGVPYKWGGVSKSGMDCSGFVLRVYQDALGLQLPHNSEKLGRMGKAVPRESLKGGDVVLFGNFMGINHVGIYMQENKFIHASEKNGVMVSSLEEEYFRKNFKGARRIVE